MAIIFMDGFEKWEPKPPGEFAVPYSEYIAGVIWKLDLEHFLDYPYIELTNAEDFALIQFYL